MEMLDAIRDLLFRLTPYLPVMVGGLILLALILTGALVQFARRVRKARKPDEAEGFEDGGKGSARLAMAEDPDYEPFASDPEDLPLLPMRKSFQHALKLLRTHVAGRDWRYAIPWYLLLGPEQSGKSTLVAHTGMDLPIGHPAEDFEDLRPACKWWFFDRGVVIDAAGALVRRQDGRGSNSRAWSKFLGYLDRYRPRRPADGIILTVPIEDILAPDGTVRPPEDIAQRADALYKKLWQAQARLGLAFPVYVVVTKLDRLPGFRELVDCLPDHALADMLGWASPYSFETEFREGWMDEAADTVGAALHQAQMEIFATAGDTAPAETLYSLPAAFEGLREPLRIYMRQLFKPSVYHDSFSLRGIWFTGDSGLEDRTADRPVPVLGGVYGGPRARQAYPVFLQDLFETKIFPEKNMARPVKRALLSRNKIAIGAQAASAAVVVLGGLTLWYLHGALHDDVETVTPFIAEVNQDVRDVTAATRANADLGAAGSFNRERALRLLSGMAALETGSFTTLLIPSSWFANVDSRVVSATTNAFNIFILQSLGAALDERGTAITAGRLPPPRDTSVLDAASEDTARAVQPVERGPAYERLRHYVEAVRDFETAVGRYNLLRETRDLEDVQRLVAYLFDVQLPESFIENSAFYERALSEANYRTVPLDAYRRGVRERYARFEREALATLYGENPLLLDLRALATRLDQSAATRAGGLAQLTALRDLIASAATRMDDPGFDWMDDPAFDPSIAYAPMIDRVGGSQLLGPDLAAALDRAHRQGVSDIQETLPTIRSVNTGPILAEDGERTMLRLAEPLRDLRAVIAALFETAFMREGRYQPLPAAAPVGTAVEWDAAVLGEALDLIDAYDAFMADELDRVPRGLGGLVRGAGAERLESVVNDRIAAAMTIPRRRGSTALQAEETLRRAVDAFAESGAFLGRILDTYDDLGREDSYLDLLDLSTATAFELIEQADALFSGGAFYIPRGGDFSYWQGDPGLALQAFRARDAFELRDILAQQRGRIALIAQSYVKPVADFLQTRTVRLSDRDAVLAAKWRRIVDELTKYELQQADNTVAELERFITGPLMDVTFETCGETLAETDLNRRSADFFLTRINQLGQDLRNRCLELAGVEAQAAYTAIADAFDDRLAGRYPFTLTPFDPDMQEVSPRDLRAFFARYDREIGGARLALEQAEDLGFERDRALEFLTRMDAVRAFLGPWLAGPGAEDAPVYDMTVRFRVNRDREAGADRVIDWRLSAGSETVDLRSQDRTLRWSLGTPLTLSFRWAANSDRVPAAAIDRPQVTVTDRTAEITYDNSWSLVDLIRRHRAGSDDFSDFVDPRPHTLRIELPTRPEAGGALDTARLFVRVELTAPQDGEAVPVILTPLPFEAPRLSP